MVFGLDHWHLSELREIADRGFSLLNARLPDTAIEVFATESAGSPQLMQSLCLQSCFPHQARIDEARRAQEEKHARERAAAERWENELRPRALKLIAARTTKLRWTPVLLDLVLDRIASGNQLRELLPPFDKLPPARYAQAAVVALAVRASWRRENLFQLLKTLGIRLRPNDLERPDGDGNGTVQPPETSPRKSARRPSRGKKATRH